MNNTNNENDNKKADDDQAQSNTCCLCLPISCGHWLTAVYMLLFGAWGHYEVYYQAIMSIWAQRYPKYFQIEDWQYAAWAFQDIGSIIAFYLVLRRLISRDDASKRELKIGLAGMAIAKIIILVQVILDPAVSMTRNFSVMHVRMLLLKHGLATGENLEIVQIVVWVLFILLDIYCFCKIDTYMEQEAAEAQQNDQEDDDEEQKKSLLAGQRMSDAQNAKARRNQNDRNRK